MPNRPVAVIVVAALLLLAGAAGAAAGGTTHHFFGARALGMGGAYTGVVDDATALYWNPGAIGLSPLSGIITADARGINSMANLRELLEDGDELADWEGAAAGGVGLLAAGNVGFIGAGAIADGRVDVTRSGDENIAGTAELVSGAGIGMAYDVLGRSAGAMAVRAGAVVRTVHIERTSFKGDGSSPSITEETFSGRGYAADVGVHVKATDILSIGGTVRNLFTHVRGADGSAAEGPEPEFQAGVALRPPLLGGTVAVDVASGGQFRYGVEKTFLFGLLAARLGQIHSDAGSDTTAGLGVAFGPFAVDAAIITPDFEHFGFALEGRIRF